MHTSKYLSNVHTKGQKVALMFGTLQKQILQMTVPKIGNLKRHYKIYIYLLDASSVFKQNKPGWNPKFSFLTDCLVAVNSRSSNTSVILLLICWPFR